MYLIVGIFFLLAGFVQGVTGFGAGIVIMSLLPYILPIREAVLVTNCAAVFLSLMMCWQYRKDIQPGILVKPLVFYLIGSSCAMLLAGRLDTYWLKLGFAVFLLVLATYFLSGKKLQGNPSLTFIILASGISGICDGLFGIGGPLMVVLFLALTQTQFQYLASLQALFSIVGLYNLVFRISQGLLTVSLLPVIALGMGMIFLGLLLGNRVVEKVSQSLLAKLTYGMIGLSGLVTLVTTLFF